MQTAVDSTALMLAKDITSIPSDQLQTKAGDYFKAMFNRPEVSPITINVAYTTSGGSQVVVKASGPVKTNFMAIMSISTVNVGVSSLSKWGNTKLRVALVLDNTGSMYQGGVPTSRFHRMQNAAIELVNILYGNRDTVANFWVSVVPYTAAVNIGASRTTWRSSLSRKVWPRDQSMPAWASGK